MVTKYVYHALPNCKNILKMKHFYQKPSSGESVIISEKGQEVISFILDDCQTYMFNLNQIYYMYIKRERD